MAVHRSHVSHYRLDSVLGQGGMGIVYLGEDERLHRAVAVKFLLPELAGDEGARRRFLHEGRAAAALNHPNAATIFEVGSEHDEIFLAMEFVPGRSLREVAADGALAWSEVIDVTLEILAALNEAHAHGIVHRDIKSANIRRTLDGHVKVMDFGLAKITDGTTLTSTGGIVGTAAYMSPQQVCGDRVDARSDLFSLGVVMYELLTGRLPFTGDQMVAVAHAILHEDPITIRELSPDTPAELEHIVFKAMMKNVAVRYQTAGEMAEDLVRFRDYERRRSAGAHEELDLIATQDVFAVRRERFRAPLAGRDVPLARLTALHAEARLGEGATAIVAGEAGIGKTRLLDEFRQRCNRERTRVITSSCLFGVSPGSYTPFVEAFRQYFALRGVTSAATLQAFIVDHAPRLAGSLPVLHRFLRFTFGGNGPATEEELREVVDELVAFIADERPLVLVIEDLHWADQGTIQLFHFLARRAPGRRLLLLGTFRPEDTVSETGERPHPLPSMLQLLSREERAHRIELHRLGRGEVVAMLDGLYPRHDWSEEFPTLLYREAEGNPFFLVEILKLLTAEGVLVAQDGRWMLSTAVDRISVPEKVYDVVMRRLGRLSPREREILEMGAVEGDVFHSGTISRGLSIERMTLLKTLQFLEQVHHLIHATGPQYHFDHSKIREVLYDSIPPELRIEYHTVVGQFLRDNFGESESHASIIAHNLLAAGLREDALPFLVRAAAAAARLFAHADAIRYLELAERVLHDLHPESPPPERVQMLAGIRRRLGDSEYSAGRYRAALTSYETALALAEAIGDQPLKARLLRAIGRMQYLLGQFAASRRTYDDAIAQYGTLVEQARAAGDQAMRAHAQRELGKLLFFEGDLDGAQACLTEALEGATALHDDELRAKTLNNLGGVHYQRGSLETALECHRASLELRERRQDDPGLAQSHKNLGMIQYRLGALDQAAQELDLALGLYRKVVDRRGEAVTLRHLGNVHYERGDHIGAQRHWEASLFLCRELGSGEDLARCLNNLGYLHFEQARYASAERLLQESLEVTVRLGARPSVTQHVNRAELCLSLDQLERAGHELGIATDLARETGARADLGAIAALRAHLAVRRGDVASARGHADEALRVAEPTGHAENFIRALLASARVELAAGQSGEAARRAGEARDFARWARMSHFELSAALAALEAAVRGGADGVVAHALAELVRRTGDAGFATLAARAHDLAGELHARAGDPVAAAAAFAHAGDRMQEVLSGMSEDDRRAFVHHPEWRAAIGRLLDALMRLGRRDEALAFLEPFGGVSCDVPGDVPVSRPAASTGV
jgi:tetratricopeptide (TPR) repeat protein/predicted Ser/Thr protein kinase